jgi:hypothetical protein
MSDEYVNDLKSSQGELAVQHFEGPLSSSFMDGLLGGVEEGTNFWVMFSIEEEILVIFQPIWINERWYWLIISWDPHHNVLSSGIVLDDLDFASASGKKIEILFRLTDEEA